MKKKLFALILIFVFVYTGTISAYALENEVASFKISPIKANQKDKFIGVDIEVNSKYINSTMFVAFYMDNRLTKLTPFDVSTTKSFTFNPKLSRVKKDGETLSPIEKQATAISVGTESNNTIINQTPDKIKVFIWDKTNLKPKTICDNVLTPEMIQDANAEVVKSLKIVPLATAFIRENHLTWEEDYLAGIADKWDTHLFPIMDYIDLCAKGALTDAETHLLTSPFAQNRYRDNLSQIRNLLNEAPAEQKSKIADLLDPTALGKEYYTALNNSMKFLDFSLN